MNHKFWKGILPISLISNDQLTERIIKLCAVGSNYLILCNDKSLYFCTVENENLHSKKIPGVSAKDISYHQGSVYIIDIDGRLYKTDPSLEKKEHLVVTEESKHCAHGFKCPSHEVKFKSVITSDFGKLFISNDGQLWGSGRMPEIAINSDNIKKVPFFEGRTVYSASIGDNFAAVIARKTIYQSGDCDSDSENDEEIYATNCPQCHKTKFVGSTGSIPLLIEKPLGVGLLSCNENSISTSKTDPNVEVYSSTGSSYSSNEISKNQGSQNIDESNNVSSVELQTLIHQKSNKILNNAGAAKQFISKPLSWVVAGEDYLVEYAEKPTRIIKTNVLEYMSKANVSNLTNLVYEGVKTVGDKVATLSRHVSGSSDSNDLTEMDLRNHSDDMFTVLLGNSCKSYLEGLQNSTSTISSDKEFETKRINENIKKMSKLGKNILATELWTWGDISYGQLGKGDTIKRLIPVDVMSLSGFGIQKVSCGKWHCSALTLDGRLYLWGYNRHHQVSFDGTDNKSGPKQFTINLNTDRIKDVVANDHHTVVYTQNENIYYMGKHAEGFTETVINLNEKINEDSLIEKKNEIELVNINEPQREKNTVKNFFYPWKILSSGDLSYCCFENNKRESEFQDLSIAQRHLEEMILIHQTLIKPFLNSKAISNLHRDYETICNIFNDILNITALNVVSMSQYVERQIEESDIYFIKNLDEFIFLYNIYNMALSNLIAIGGFSCINSIIDVPTKVFKLFTEQLPSNSQKCNKKSSEFVIRLAFNQPLTRLRSYKCICQSLIRKKMKGNPEIKTKSLEKLNKLNKLLDTVIEDQDKCRKEAEVTQLFWETSGKFLDQYRTPERRLIRESKSSPLNMVNPGRFSSHWFILFNDLFVHYCSGTTNVHPLEVIWVEPESITDATENLIHIITPEEVISVTTLNESDKTNWIQSFYKSIKTVLNKKTHAKPPSARTASYTFSNKSEYFKEAKYSGRWLDGKMHGNGKVKWPDGRCYEGQFQHNTLCGHGKMEIPGVGNYTGQWADNLQNGYGILTYFNEDYYEGFFKDGVPHGHGIKRQGDLNSSSTATLYTGEWVNGLKHGYGVMNDIRAGEKYLGSWSDDRKHGCGLVVRLDGLYYEGSFAQDVFMGQGLMIFENGTYYEGEFRSADMFAGKGTLTLANGDKVKGALSGPWAEGIKISNATMHINLSKAAAPDKPDSFGKLCVAPNQKWNAIFKQWYQFLGICEKSITSRFTNGSVSQRQDNSKVWQNVAVAINCARRDSNKSKLTKDNTPIVDNKRQADCLEVIPSFGQNNLTLKEYKEVKQYLQNAFDSLDHPLGRLVLSLTNAFNNGYSGLIVHQLLLPHAVEELKTVTGRLYRLLRVLFPALPDEDDRLTLADEDHIEMDEEPVSAPRLLLGALMPRVHQAVFALYNQHNRHADLRYWNRLKDLNRRPHAHLKDDIDNFDPNLRDEMFDEAVETLQQLKTTFCPAEKRLIIQGTVDQITATVQKYSNKPLGTSEYLPPGQWVVVRARVPQLVSEVHFIEDFLEPGQELGRFGYVLATIKSCLELILKDEN